MEINIYGSASKKLKAELSEAAEFFARCLMHSRMVDNLELDIEIENKLDVQGLCINEDDNRRSRFFTVQLRKDASADEMIQTLAHEMIHVKQYAKNEHVKKHLTTKGGLKIQSYWLGKLWKPIKDEVDYYDSPWEIEAYGREVGLMHRWIKHKEKA